MPGIRDQVGAIPTQLAFALVCVGIGSIVGNALHGAACRPVLLTDGQPGGDRNLPGRLGNAPAGCFGAGAGANVANSRSGHRGR